MDNFKFISWNVNGLRACIKKGFDDFFNKADADIYCIQETKMQKEQADFDFPGYDCYWNSAEKKGYSGTCIITRIKPLNITYDINNENCKGEGRAITLEFDKFFLVNVYVPNSKEGLLRLPYRMEWEDAFRKYICDLDKKKPVIICGDMNVAHEEIDLKNPKPNEGSAGFSKEERAKMTELLGAGFVDSFRYFYPEKTGAYSWWSYRFRAREHNAGWRIDYFLVSERFKENLKDSAILSDVLGSDHCPVSLEFSV